MNKHTSGFLRAEMRESFVGEYTPKCPDSWAIKDKRGRTIFGISAQMRRTAETKEADAKRLVACWNACEGINPDAVPDLLEACKAIECASGSVAITNALMKVSAAIIKAEGED